MNHRAAVGGLWEEIGKLQLDFMVAQGLEPHHKLLDIGCGCLRGGIKFIEYLDDGNYHGIDKDANLLKAGLKEIKIAGLGSKLYHLMPNGTFEFSKFETEFDYAIAQSVFTHINLNEILLCLLRSRQVLKDGGALYATFFNCNDFSLYDGAINRATTDGQTVSTQAAFSRSLHYTYAQMTAVANWAGMQSRYIGDWNHPRKQEIMVFYK